MQYESENQENRRRIRKNAAKITELQARQRELEKQRLELENLDIIGMVRNMGLTPDQLAALIQGARPTETKEATDYE